MQSMTRVAALAMAAALTARPLTAQIDYRNLDEGRPVRTEDAYPVERRALEFVMPYSYELERGGTRLHLVSPELAWGLLPNAMAGLKLPFVAVDGSGPGGADYDFAGPRLFGLYNLNTESRVIPALALRADLALPLGGFAGDETRLGLTGIATRSWGRTRLHVNGTVGIGADPEPGAAGAVHGVPDWAASVAADRTLLRNSLLLIGELGARQAASGEPTEVAAALGARLQMTPTLVLDAGVERRLSREGADLGLTIGLTHAFGFRPASRPPAPVRSAADPATGSPPALDRRDEVFYYPGGFNWEFLRSYPAAARLFNAFDYGHAVLYERLLTAGERTPDALDAEYRFLTGDLLIRPPRFAIAEEAVMPSYAKLAWQAKQMFDWAHVLHRQIYDAYADETLSTPARDSLIERLTDHYLGRPDVAFVPVPKTMALMDEQPFSQIFRREHEKFNGLIWAYHWLQVGLYEPLIAGETAADRKMGVQATLARFWEMVQSEEYPSVMPMTSAIAPEFSRRHPRAAVIFDNLHMMHDIISDVLASPDIPHERKRAEIYRQLAEFRDPATNVITMDEWRNMADHMGGVAAMGGPATELLTAPQAPAAGHGHHQ